MSNVHENLKLLRNINGLTQSELSEKSGLETSYISQIEGGHKTPSLTALEKLAKALEIDPGMLLGKIEIKISKQ